MPNVWSCLGLPQIELTLNNYWQHFRALAHSFSFVFLCPFPPFPLPPPLFQLHASVSAQWHRRHGAGVGGSLGNRKLTTNWMGLASTRYWPWCPPQ